MTDSKYVSSHTTCPNCDRDLKVIIFIYPIKSSIFGAEFSARVSSIEKEPREKYY